MTKVYVDFMKHGGGVVFLTAGGTLSDLRRQGIELSEGMTLHMYQDDSDAAGRRGYLHAEGQVVRSFANGQACWAARLTSDVAFTPGDNMGPAGEILLG